MQTDLPYSLIVVYFEDMESPNRFPDWVRILIEQAYKAREQAREGL